jgi:hypothetical protein
MLRRTFVRGLVLGLCSYLSDASGEPYSKNLSLIKEDANEPFKEFLASISRLYSAEIDSAIDRDALVRNHVANVYDKFSSYDTISELKIAVVKSIQEDFVKNNIVYVDYWSLSETFLNILVVASATYPELIMSSNSVDSIDPNEFEIGDFAYVEGWGPKSVDFGQVFNQQTSGNASIWLTCTGLVRNHVYKLMFDNIVMESTVSYIKGVITGDLSEHETLSFTKISTNYNIWLVDLTAMKKQLVGSFLVRENPMLLQEMCNFEAKGDLINITQWGPKAFSNENTKKIVWMKFNYNDISLVKGGSFCIDGKLFPATINDDKGLASAEIDLIDVMPTKRIKLFFISSGLNGKQFVGLIL